MTRAEVEDNVVEKLGSVINAEIEPFPDDPDDHNPKRDETILVAYAGKRRIGDSNGRGTRQVNNQRVVLTFAYRNRRTHQGVLGDLGVAEDELIGHRIDNQFLKLADENFVNYDKEKERWIYTQTYELAQRVNYTS